MAPEVIDSPNSPSSLHRRLIELSGRILESLFKAPSELSSSVSVMFLIRSLLYLPDPEGNCQILSLIKPFTLAVSILLSPQSSELSLLVWIPRHSADVVCTSFSEIALTYVVCLGDKNLRKLGELCLDGVPLGNVERLVIELWPEFFPELRDWIKESSMDKEEGITAVSAGVTVGYAIVAGAPVSVVCYSG